MTIQIKFDVLAASFYRIFKKFVYFRHNYFGILLLACFLTSYIQILVHRRNTVLAFNKYNDGTVLLIKRYTAGTVLTF